MTEQYRQLTLEDYLRRTQSFDGVSPVVIKKLEVKRGAIDRVVGIVAEDFYLTPEEILGPSRRRDIAIARHVVAYLLFNSQEDITYGVIALGIGRSDHTTIINSIKRVEEQMAIDPALRDRIQTLLPICSPTSQ